jgi:hypothetical protein
MSDGPLQKQSNQPFPLQEFVPVADTMERDYKINKNTNTKK